MLMAGNAAWSQQRAWAARGGEGEAKVPMDITDPVLRKAFVRAMSVRMVPPVPLLDSDDEEQSDGEGGILMNMSEPRDRMADVYIAAAKILRHAHGGHSRLQELQFMLEKEEEPIATEHRGLPKSPGQTARQQHKAHGDDAPPDQLRSRDQ